MMVNIKDYLDKILVVYKCIDCDVCNGISSILDELGYKYEKKVRDKLSTDDFKENKLVIIVGGDGTTLRVSHMINNDSIVFSVNSHPKITEGFLTRATPEDFRQKFSQLAEGKAPIIQLPRLQVKINDIILPMLALNEVSISSHKPYFVQHYELDGNVEKSTGLIISTPLGSTGWARSAGGKEMPLTSSKMQFVVREPYHGRISKVRNQYKFIDDFRVKVLSKGIVVFDSYDKEFKFNKGDSITITKSDSTIYFVNFE